LILIVCALIVAAAVAWAGRLVAARLETRGASTDRPLRIIEIFAPGIAAAAEDPRALLTWQPLALVARSQHPEDFAALDRAAGGTFPFSTEQIQAAHSRWTTTWLTWERNHDAEYKLKAALLVAEMEIAGATPALRARADAIEHEKLDAYQRRYEEYTRVAKALQSLSSR
jgi:hypothetical protein